MNLRRACRSRVRVQKPRLSRKPRWKAATPHRALPYDKNKDMHYDIISAFIKSMRGSDPDAALYWLARMIDGGEDPKYIARRMFIHASEDVGNADPQALLWPRPHSRLPRSSGTRSAASTWRKRRCTLRLPRKATPRKLASTPRWLRCAMGRNVMCPTTCAIVIVRARKAMGV